MKQPIATDAELTPRQARFVAEYVIDLNATQAAIRAGYAATNADVQGPRLLGNPSVAAAIAVREQDICARLDVSAVRTLLEYKRIGYGDPRQVLSWGPDGVRLKASDQLTDDAAALVAEISEAGGGVKVKTHDKLGALKVLAQVTGLVDEKAGDTVIDQRSFTFVINTDGLPDGNA